MDADRGQSSTPFDIVPKKGIEVAIEAIALLAQSGVRATLDVVGGGPGKADLVSRASELGVRDQIEFSGILSQERLADRFRQATALLAPSLFDETFSQVAAEAALAGRPVIASRRAALVETVVDGRSGLLVDEGSSEALFRAMACILEEPGLALTLGEFGRRRALKHYTLSAMMDTYMRLYRNSGPTH